MTQASQWIRQFDRVKLSDTGLELAFDEVARAVGLEPTKPKPVALRDDEGVAWTFRPDRLVEDAYVELLGPHHFTPREEAKTKWRSRLIVRKTGKRLLLVDGPLLREKRYHPDVARGLVAFLVGGKKWDRLYA